MNMYENREDMNNIESRCKYTYKLLTCIIASLYFLFILPLFMFPCCDIKCLSLSGFANPWNITSNFYANKKCIILNYIVKNDAF